MLLIEPAGRAAAAEKPDQPTIRKLGNQRYQIGAIIVDKARQRFVVPGSVVKLGAPGDPLEFLAGTKGSHRLYETVLELSANAFEFNLACILIGLKQRSAKPQMNFDRRPVDGDPVNLYASWSVDGKMIRKSVGELLRVGKNDSPGSADWVYTGSPFTQSGELLAQVGGVLVGFVLKGESIIQHRSGLGLSGGYGAVRVNHAVTPPAGTRIEFIVERSVD